MVTPQFGFRKFNDSFALLNKSKNLFFSYLLQNLNFRE